MVYVFIQLMVLHARSLIRDRQSKRIIGTGRRHGGSTSLYVLDTLHLPPSFASSVFLSAKSMSRSILPFSSAQWHHRLGHLCGSYLSTLVQQGVLGRVPVDTSISWFSTAPASLEPASWARERLGPSPARVASTLTRIHGARS